MLDDGEKMRFQPVDMISWLLTINIPYNSKDPNHFEPMIQ
jgi:hypothetical protein